MSREWSASTVTATTDSHAITRTLTDHERRRRAVAASATAATETGTTASATSDDEVFDRDGIAIGYASERRLPPVFHRCRDEQTRPPTH
jgi:hypothetical protein